MIYRKPLQLAAAIGFAASLAFGSAFAEQHEGGMQEGMQEGQESQAEEQQQPQAQEPRAEVEEEGVDIGKIDRDQDKLVSTEEYKEWRESVFGDLDADRNEELTVLEFIVLHPTKMERQQLQARFRNLDEDKDGKVTKQQYIDKTTDQFKEADTDGDGKLSKEELENVIQKRG